MSDKVGYITQGSYTCNGSKLGCERERFGGCEYHDREIERLRGAIKEAYYEGWHEHETTIWEDSDNGPDEDWRTSKARRALEADDERIV